MHSRRIAQPAGSIAVVASGVSRIADPCRAWLAAWLSMSLACCASLATAADVPLRAPVVGPPLVERIDDSVEGTADRAVAGGNQLQDSLAEKIDRALSLRYPAYLNTRDHNPWQVMHSIVAYGVETEIFRGGPGGERVNAIGWLCWNQPCRGERLLSAVGGRVVAGRGPALQGHEGQFLAVLAQSHVPKDYALKIGEGEFRVADLIESEKRGCRSGIELTFKLIGLAHYLDSDATWKNDRGETWSIQRLLREEMAQAIHDGACGGTHRLMGISYGVYKRRREARPLTGEFRRAEIYMRNFREYTIGLQNEDGSFSTAWFRYREDRRDLARRLQTSGHILEWLALAIPEDELQRDEIASAANYLADLLLENPSRRWEIGPLGHALHALAIYQRRAYGATAHGPQTTHYGAPDDVARHETDRQQRDANAGNGTPHGVHSPSATPGDTHRSLRDGRVPDFSAALQPRTTTAEGPHLMWPH